MISIIVPVYKVEKYIGRCIESVIAQTYKDWELLLVDDGSPDRSGTICDEYAQKDKRIRVFHKENGGVSSARNYGLCQAQGEWVVFIDSDDWVENYYLEVFLQEKPTIDTLTIQGRFNDKTDGSIIDIVAFMSKTYKGNDLVRGIVENDLLFHGAPYCKLYNRKIVLENGIKFPENYSYGEDTCFFLWYLRFVDGIKLMPNTGYHYIHYEGTNLSNKQHKCEDLLAFLKDSHNAISELDDESGSLKKEYFVTSEGLVKKSIISLYSSGCAKEYRRALLLEEKRMSHLIISDSRQKISKDIAMLMLTSYVPVVALDFFLSFYFKQS